MLAYISAPAGSVMGFWRFWRLSGAGSPGSPGLSQGLRRSGELVESQLRSSCSELRGKTWENPTATPSRGPTYAHMISGESWISRNFNSFYSWDMLGYG